ncbi:hypothetical protein I3843_07G132900 [Carya illinoinensis]|nr:hypothetical protein I3760_07G133800 [Carya illinoinensis]KAG7971415.1 hypothetical protein I3843_07G132900 [Carya illinoinensis]
MASIRSLDEYTVTHLLQLCAKPISNHAQFPKQAFLPLPISRRSAILISSLPFGLLVSHSPPSEARERRNKKTIPLEDYVTSPEGLKYYDVVEGKGPIAEKGSTVQVHFDCMYRGITAVSSRESKLLAGNRIISQVLIFALVWHKYERERERIKTQLFLIKQPESLMQSSLCFN